MLLYFSTYLGMPKDEPFKPIIRPPYQEQSFRPTTTRYTLAGADRQAYYEKPEAVQFSSPARAPEGGVGPAMTYTTHFSRCLRACYRRSTRRRPALPPLLLIIRNNSYSLPPHSLSYATIGSITSPNDSAASLLISNNFNTSNSSYTKTNCNN